MASEGDHYRLRIETLADAGHWLHVDAPGPLLDLLAAALTDA